MNKLSENLDPFYKELGQTYETIAMGDQAPIAKLGLYATRSLQLFEEYQDRFMEDPAGMFHPLINNSDSWFSSSARLFTETINDAVHAGKIRNIDTEKASILLLNAIFALMLRRIHLTATDGIEDDVRDLIDLYLNGITAARMPAPVGPAGFAA